MIKFFCIKYRPIKKTGNRKLQKILNYEQYDANGFKTFRYDVTFFDNYLAMYRNSILRLYYCTAMKRDATRFSETSVNVYQIIWQEAVTISALHTAGLKVVFLQHVAKQTCKIPSQTHKTSGNLVL